MENSKKVYESKKIYGQKYNKANSHLQIDRNLIDLLKEKLKDSKTSIKSHIENLIKKDLDSNP